MRYVIFLWLAVLIGCSNSVDENVGGLPNIEITGLLLNGNIKDASIQVVGIDNYGQPQRNASGEIYADRFFSDENGRYNLSINGAATGSLLFVVKSYFEEGHNTQIRCALKNGCLDEAGDSVFYGQWYDAANDFELWAVVNDAQSIRQVHVGPLTHLAAKLAFTEFVSNGTCSSANCDGVVPVNNMFTPQSIHEANTRVQALFNSSSNIHGFLEPFSPFVSSTLDSVVAVDGAKHGLLNLTLQYQAREENKTLNQVLASWLEGAFLKNAGQLYGDDQTNTPAQWSLKTAFTNANIVKDELALPDNASLTSAASALLLIADGLSNTVTNEKGSNYSETLADQIAAAKVFVGNAQSWIADYETKSFGNFLDDDTATEITSMEAQWEAFQKTLGPELQSVFLPMVQIVDYALICTANNSCAAGQAYSFDELTASIAYEANESRFTYTADSQPNTLVKGQLLNFGENTLIKSFTFSQDIYVESATGLAIVQSRNDDKANIKVYLDSALQSGVAPAVRRIEFDFPKITLKAKTAVNASTYQDLVYTADTATLVMQGVKDPVRPNEPIHFNLESLSLLGEVSNGSDVLDVELIINGSNASLHYPALRFPDLNFVWKSSDIKNYAQFDASGLDNAEFAGWLELPSNVVMGETLSSAVSYNELSAFSQLPAALKTELQITSYNQFNFGELRYPGGATALVVYKQKASDAKTVKQCNEIDGQWLCSDPVALKDLGCESAYGNDASFNDDVTVADAFLFLKNNVNSDGVGCIPEVKIVGRGVYEINYGAITQFTDGDTFDVTLETPHYLGVSSFSIRLLSRFVDGAEKADDTPVLFSVIGAFTDPKNISVAFAVSHDFIGFGNTSSLGLVEVIPYGERTLWFAIGNSSDAEQNSVIYYILDDAVSLLMTGFDYTTGESYHDAALGFIRYANTLVGTLRKENGLYVIRYTDGSWQLL
ncbi:hypothetical protein QNI23_009025 [Bermanella sp. WJH001]|uniref:hypothetical protein n=1 Tax=Bermanella sp. WJH001 TaxID=3048005 RepID=UPI0024BD7313|nr:hypothetical protein [Bermanella sp. WJH001]MDJ1537134.1 hypothetical protein [Bermanella sp. WJH001]